MSLLFNYFPDRYNYTHLNIYGTNNTISCETNEQYHQRQYYKQQYFEQNCCSNPVHLNSPYKLNNNFFLHPDKQDKYDKRNIPIYHSHHPGGVRFIQY